MSQRGRGTAAGRGKNLSSPIVCRVTEIVNQPFPSKVHALTGTVNRHSGVLRVSAEVLLNYDDPKMGKQARELFDDAQELLERIAAKNLLIPRGVYEL